MVPAEWMEVPAAWDVVEPCVSHNSWAMLEASARSNCMIMFLDGRGALFPAIPCLGVVAVLDFTDSFAPSMVFGRGGGLPGVKQTVPRSEIQIYIYIYIYICQDPGGSLCSA